MSEEKKQSELGRTIEDILNGVKDETDVEFRAQCIDIGWSQKGVGWGHLTFGISVPTGKWFADTESMDEESITAIIVNAAPILAKRLLEIEQGIDVVGRGESKQFSVEIGPGKEST